MEDDKTATVTVGDAQYEMDDGSWFLVSTQTDPITVYQLHRNPSRKQLTKEEFRALAKTDDDIAEFFRKAAEVE